MHEHTYLARFGLMVTTGKQTGDDAGEHIATAGCRHAGIAGGVEHHLAVGHAEGREMALEDDIGLQLDGQVDGFLQTLAVVAATGAAQAVKLLGVRGQDETLGQLLYPCTVVGKDVQGVGIHHSRTLRAAQLGDKGDGSLLKLAQARTDAKGIKLVCTDGIREMIVFMVYLDNGFGNGNLQDVEVVLGCENGEFACARAQTGTRGKDGSACHAITAGNEEGMTHQTLMGEIAAGNNQCTHVVGLLHRIHRIGLRNILLGKVDVEHFQTTDILLVVGEEHGEFLHAKGQGKVGMDDMGVVVVGVALRHQSGGKVDADHLARRLVDVFHQ